MLCANCGKREAEILIKQISGSAVHTCALCRECAEKLGIVSADAATVTISFSVGDGGAAQARHRRAAYKREKEEREDALVCPECGMSYARFRESGLLGCERCYEAFRVPLGELLQDRQGAESHWGGSFSDFADIAVPQMIEERAARSVSDRQSPADVARLERELSKAVDAEDYERAANIRDMLAALRGGEAAEGCRHGE